MDKTLRFAVAIVLLAGLVIIFMPLFPTLPALYQILILIAIMLLSALLLNFILS